jgi:hypothetical protein
MVVGHLAGDYGPAFVGVDEHGLVTRGVARCRDEANAWDNLVLAVDRAIGRPWEVDPIEHVEVEASIPVGGATGVGGVPLVLVHEDRDTGNSALPPMLSKWRWPLITATSPMSKSIARSSSSIARRWGR